MPAEGWQSHGEGAAFRDPHIIVLSNDDELQRLVRQALGSSYPRITRAADCGSALRAAQDCPFALLLADLTDGSVDALAALRRVLVERRPILALAIWEMDEPRAALAAARLGASECLTRPPCAGDLLEAVESTLQEGLQRGTTLHERRRLSFAGGGKRLVGASRPMRHLLRRMDIVRHVDSSVIIRGETGTGKELVARAIHRNSPRAREPFVKLNCGAIPRELLESELFGHERGSFTGAMQQRIGRFEMAHGGTILLDEIGDMPLELQVKLLGVVQDRTVQRVGGDRRIPVDVRIIAATHQDLETAIEEGRFREDLYYRLKVVTIRVPTLRERRDDIPLLAYHFLKVYNHVTGKALEGVTPEAIELLRRYDYPGNVRELENFLESAAVFCQGRDIRPDDLPPPVRNATGSPARELRIAAGTPMEEVERLCIMETLKHTEGNKRRAAALLGMSEKSIYNKLDRYNIPLKFPQSGHEDEPVGTESRSGYSTA
ncbi:MAG: sigma-54 dependent transcriptional regulator [Candidatus Brocadiia bacterium]